MLPRDCLVGDEDATAQDFEDAEEMDRYAQARNKFGDRGASAEDGGANALGTTNYMGDGLTSAELLGVKGLHHCQFKSMKCADF